MNRIALTKMLCLGLVGVVAACSAPPRASDTASVFQADPGRLLTAAQKERNVLANAGRTYAVTYEMTSFTGAPTVVYGTVAIPRRAPPAGGYPVVSWGNGTTGVAPQCAPSLDANADRDAYLNEWLARGYVVLQTDYEGWGALGPRPDIDGLSNGSAISELVSAAHALPVPLRADWLAVGHSSGGGAALWAASFERNAKGKYPLAGVIALAPIGPGILKFVNDVANGAPVGPAAPFVSITVLDALAVDDGIALKDVVAEPMLPQVEMARKVCLGDLFRLPALQPGQYLKKGPAFDRMARYVAAQDASNLSMRVPVFIAQGDKDETTVKPDTTKTMVSALCGRGASIEYREYPGQTHRGVIAASRQDAFQFASAALAGGKTANTCGSGRDGSL